VEEAVRDRGQSTESDAAEDSDAAAPNVSAGPARPSGSKLRPPGLLELEDLLAERLSTAVSVTMGARRGRLVVDFADLEDLERLYHLMSGAPDGAGHH
jgi:ParB family chromosome partitioning protein